MKKILSVCISIGLTFSSVFADVQFWDFRENAKRPGEYYPISYNQYGIDTGVLQFPDDVKVLYHQKAKQVFPDPEMIPSSELLSKDYQERQDYYENQYQTNGNRGTHFPGKEYDMMGRGKIPIPHYEMIFNPKKGDNHIPFECHSYTSTDGTSFFIIE